MLHCCDQPPTRFARPRGCVRRRRSRRLLPWHLLLLNALFPPPLAAVPRRMAGRRGHCQEGGGRLPSRSPAGLVRDSQGLWGCGGWARDSVCGLWWCERGCPPHMPVPAGPTDCAPHHPCPSGCGVATLCIVRTCWALLLSFCASLLVAAGPALARLHGTHRLWRLHVLPLPLRRHLAAPRPIRSHPTTIIAKQFARSLPSQNRPSRPHPHVPSSLGHHSAERFSPYCRLYRRFRRPRREGHCVRACRVSLLLLPT